MELLAIRHLTTEDNREQRFSSGDRDISIIPNQRIPKAVANHLKKFEVERLTVAYTGLKRSIQTAQLLIESLHYLGKPLIIPQFKERFGGQFAGLKFSELQRAFPELTSPSQFWGIEAPNKGLESVAVFLSRIEDGIALLASSDAFDVVVLVAHAGSLKGIKAVLTTKEVDERKQILCEPTPEHQTVFQFHLERKLS